MIKFRSPRTYEQYCKMAGLARKYALTPWQRYGVLAVFLLSWMIFLFFLIKVLIPQLDKLVYFGSFQFIINIAIILGFYFLSLRLYLKVTYARINNWPKAKIYAERNNFDIEVDETGIRYIGKNLQMRYGWSIMDKLLEQKDGSIVLVMDLHVHHFKMEDFGSKDLRDEFIQIAQAHMREDAVIELKQ